MPVSRFPSPSAEGRRDHAGLPDCGVKPYLGLEIVRIVVSVLGVHLWLIQAFAHVAGIFISEAGNWMTGQVPQGRAPLKPLFLTVR